MTTLSLEVLSAPVALNNPNLVWLEHSPVTASSRLSAPPRSSALLSGAIAGGPARTALHIMERLMARGARRAGYVSMGVGGKTPELRHGLFQKTHKRSAIIGQGRPDSSLPRLLRPAQNPLSARSPIPPAIYPSSGQFLPQTAIVGFLRSSRVTLYHDRILQDRV